MDIEVTDNKYPEIKPLSEVALCAGKGFDPNYRSGQIKLWEDSYWYGGENSGGNVGDREILELLETIEEGDKIYIYALRHKYFNESSYRHNNDENEDTVNYFASNLSPKDILAKIAEAFASAWQEEKKAIAKMVKENKNLKERCLKLQVK